MAFIEDLFGLKGKTAIVAGGAGVIGGDIDCDLGGGWAWTGKPDCGGCATGHFRRSCCNHCRRIAQFSYPHGSHQLGNP